MKPLLFIALCIGIFACAEKRPVDRMDDAQLKAYASELARNYLIADGHIDLPSVLLEKGFLPGRDNDTLIHTNKGDFDYERAVKGGLDAPFMSIYIPASYQRHPDFGKGLADSLIDIVRGMAAQLPQKFALANSPTEVEANAKAGKISLPMGMENGAPVGNDLKNVKYFYDRGIRYITLTHSKNNQICDSSGDTARWNGLSPFGQQVVKEMNRVGIMVDISHVDDSTFYQVMKLTRVPCIASHSSCRSFAPTVRRDMTDDMIKALGQNGGVVMVNYYTAFIDSATANYNIKSQREIGALLAERKLTVGDTLAKPIIDQYKKAHPAPRVDVEKVADHIDHIVQVAGIDHVGIGSDYDGVDGMLPQGLEDVSSYPNLIYTLLKRGYTEVDIEKICYKNLWRVWRMVEEESKR